MDNILKELWKDAPEEPKEYWWINGKGEVLSCIKGISEDSRKSIGNYFNAREEAELAVRKLKVYKRLKDKGFRFERWGIGGEYGNTITFSDYIEYNGKTRADLDLLFGGEE